MKLFYLIPALFLILSSCQENDDLIVKVKNVSFYAASSENELFTPLPTTDSISTAYFSIQINWDIERMDKDVGYDPVETTAKNINPIDSIKIWSDQVVAGRTPGNSLNTLFYQQYSYNGTQHPLEENGGLDYNTSFYTFDEPLRKTSHLFPNTLIDPGTYNFYFRCVLRDGTILSNSLLNVIIK